MSRSGISRLKSTVFSKPTHPTLMNVFGSGPDTGSQLLITAGDNTARLRSENQFAALTGTCPRPASSGKTERNRLNRGGDRKANSALHHIVLVRMRYHQPTKDYVARRTAEGLGKKEIMRCLSATSHAKSSLSSYKHSA